MGEVEPFVVLCWESDAGYVPPFKISPRQFTIGMQYTEPMNVAVCADPPDIVVPAGDAYDLDATPIFDTCVLRECNTGKTPGVDALFSCAGSGKSDSSYV
jgi:hypothetical protein